MDLVSIIRSHKSKRKLDDKSAFERVQERKMPQFSEIPDVFFDEILVKYKLQRVDFLVLIFLYRRIYSLPNLYKDYGIGPIMSYEDMAKILEINLSELQTAIRKLESLNLIETIRAGQYYIRKYFTEEYDAIFGQTYDDF